MNAFRNFFVAIIVLLVASLQFSSTVFAATHTPKLSKGMLELKQRNAELEDEIDYLMDELHHPHQFLNNPREHQFPVGSRTYNPEHDAYHQGALSFLGGTPVLTSPYLGIRSEFDASDLIINFSSIGEDVRLLQQRQKLENALIAQGDPIPQHPIVDLSGGIDTVARSTWPYFGRHTGDLDVMRVEFDVAASINKWTSSLFVFDYDNARSGPNRVGNSRVFLNYGLLTLGNFNVDPHYFSVGQYFVPFGHFSSYMLSSTLPKILGRIKARAVTFGYHGEDGWRGSVFAFPTDTSGGNSRSTIGGDLGYGFTYHGVSFDLTASGVSNIADADGMQATGAVSTTLNGKSTFTGFGASAATEMLQHRVPAVDLRAKTHFWKISTIVEYVGTTRSFDVADLSFNGVGAMPKALNVEAAYHFYILDHKPATFAAGYERTYEALALNLPRKRFVATLSTNLLRDTILAIEYRHDKAYDATDTGTGALSCPVVLTKIRGKSSDTLSVLFGVYF